MSAYLIENNRVRTVRIERIVEESSLVKTFFFKDELCALGKPGQFVMVWLPGFDEVPMSISSANHSNSLTSVTVAKVGEATELLHQKKTGDILGVRGPLGNWFKPAKGKILLVGGGTGIAPLTFLAENLVDDFGKKMVFLLGAKTKEELLFMHKVESLFSNVEARMFVSTEDGGQGHMGKVTDLAQQVLSEEKFDTIYACGKEPMLFKIFTLAEKYKTPLQASLERLMRCAIGLCGSCTLGKYRVCIDGPVFTDTQLREVRDEFGCFKRGFDGRKVPV